MNEAPSSDPWLHTADQVAQTAQRLLPFAYGLCIALTAFVIWEEIAEPLVSAANSGGYYTFDESRAHVAANMTAALPVFPVIWGLAEISVLLRQLAKGMLWALASMSGITRLGMAVILAGLIGAVVEPWLMNPGTLGLGFSSTDFGLIGLGIGIILLGRLLAKLVQAANEVHAESQSFV